MKTTNHTLQEKALKLKNNVVASYWPVFWELPSFVGSR